MNYYNEESEESGCVRHGDRNGTDILAGSIALVPSRQGGPD